jgi:hypothetical protein
MVTTDDGFQEYHTCGGVFYTAHSNDRSKLEWLMSLKTLLVVFGPVHPIAMSPREYR